jgi:hypothetical protein
VRAFKRDQAFRSAVAEVTIEYTYEGREAS